MTIANTLSFLQNSAGALTTGTINANGAPVTVSISGSEKIRVDTNGYLLVNYTSSVGSYHLQVQGNAYISGALTVSSLTAGALTGSITTATSLAGGTAGQLHYQISPGLSGFAGPGTAGQILVSAGTSAPVYTNTSSIHVGTANFAASAGSASGSSGQVNVTAQAASASYYPVFVNSNNATATAESMFSTSSFFINPASGWVTAKVLTVNSNSNGLNILVGDDAWIGDVDQANTIRITGNQNGANGYIIFGNSNTTALGRAGTGDLTYGTNKVILNNNTATLTTVSVGAAWYGGASGEIRASNEITAYYTSDARLKENVTVISNPIEKLEQIRGVYFDWTDEHVKDRGGEDGYFVRKHDIGVIAQEVEAILPEIVATRDNGYKAVKYEKIVPLLIECIKEQQTQINQILEKLEKLANK